MVLQSGNLAFICSGKFWKLKQSVNGFDSASHSVILSLAAYIVFHLPKLPPPLFNHQQLTKIKIDLAYNSQYLSINYYFQPWCDYLTYLVQNNKSYSIGNCLYLIHQVNQNIFHFQLLNEIFQTGFYKDSNQQNIQKSFQWKLLQIYGVQDSSTKLRKKIGIANFSTAQLRTDPYRPKVHLSGIIQGIWHGNHQWKMFNILKNDIPDFQQLKKFDVFFLTGSSLSVRDTIPQIQKFCKILKSAIQSNLQLKIVGFCFGHQLINKMYDGTIIKKSKIFGLQKIKFNNILLKQRQFLSPILNCPLQQFSMSQYHSDFIDKLGNIFIPLARSNTCQVQAMISKDNRILSFQFHPQYQSAFTKGYQLRVSQYQVQDILSDFNGGTPSNQQHLQSIHFIRNAIQKFIDC